MCGIFGLMAHGQVDPAQFAALGARNIPRGNLGFGGLCQTSDGIQVFRQVTPFVPEQVRLDAATLALGHIRAPTGSQSRSLDHIHPFETADLLLAHNGLLLNYRDFPDWCAQPAVDSQVIVGGIQFHLDQGLPLVAAIQQTLKQLEGQQGCWLWHKPSAELYLWRVMAPIFYTSAAGHWGFSSARLAGPLLDEGVIYHVDRQALAAVPVGRFNFYSPYRLT